AVSRSGLIAGCSSSSGFRVEGLQEDSVSLNENWVTSGYFLTVGIPLAGGREFSERDTRQSPKVAVVNETAARRYFPGQSPIGRYGVLSYGVARRTQEIGVRMALGARRIEVMGLVLGQSAKLTALGLALGGAVAIGGARSLARMVYGVSPLDPATLLAVAVTF